MDTSIATALISSGVTIAVLLISGVFKHFTNKAQFTVTDGAALREDLMTERKGLVDEIKALSKRCSELERECLKMATENLRLTNEIEFLKRQYALLQSTIVTDTMKARHVEASEVVADRVEADEVIRRKKRGG